MSAVQRQHNKHAKIPPTMSLDSPLTDTEFDHLDEFLTDEEAPSDAMVTMMLDDSTNLRRRRNQQDTHGHCLCMAGH